MEHILTLEREIKDISSRLASAEEQHKSLFSRIDRQEKMLDTVHKLALSVNELASRQGTMQERIEGLCDDVEEIKATPAKRWNGLVEKIVMTLVGAVVTYALAKIGII